MKLTIESLQVKVNTPDHDAAIREALNLGAAHGCIVRLVLNGIRLNLTDKSTADSTRLDYLREYQRLYAHGNSDE